MSVAIVCMTFDMEDNVTSSPSPLTSQTPFNNTTSHTSLLGGGEVHSIGVSQFLCQ